jgi:hypothetical protein
MDISAKTCIYSLINILSRQAKLSYSRDHNRFPVPTSALFLSHGPRDRDPSTFELARCRGNTVIYTVYYIAVTLYRL